MNKKVSCMVLGALLLALSVRVDAQQPKKVPRIGYVSNSGDANNPGPYVVAFRHGLRELGYIEGKNILVEFRSAEGKLDRMPGGNITGVTTMRRELSGKRLQLLK